MEEGRISTEEANGLLEALDEEPLLSQEPDQPAAQVLTEAAAAPMPEVEPIAPSVQEPEPVATPIQEAEPTTEQQEAPGAQDSKRAEATWGEVEEELENLGASISEAFRAGFSSERWRAFEIEASRLA